MSVILRRAYYLFLLLTLSLNTPAQESKLMVSYTRDSLLEKIVATAHADIQAGRYDIAIIALEGLTDRQYLPLFRKELLPAVYLNLGGAYLFKGEYENCIACLHQAEFYATSQPDKHSLSLIKTYNNLSVALNRIEENEDALKYLEKAEGMAVKYRYNRLIAGIHVNKGRIYKEMKQWDKSKAEFKVALSFIDSLKASDRSVGISARETKQIIATNTGQLFLLQGKLQQSLLYFKNAQLLSRPGTNPYNTIPIVLGLGKTYAALKEYRLAEKYLSEALDISRKKKVADGEIEALQHLSRIYADIKNYEKAYQYRLAFDAKENDIRNITKLKEIRGLEIKYSIADKDRQIAESKLQIVQQQKNIGRKDSWIYGIATGSLMLLFTGFLAYRSLRYKQRNQRNQIQLLQQEKEINQLRALMQGEEKERKRIAHELHDGIGGMLAAVKMNFAAFKKKHEPYHDLDELAQLLNMLDDTSDEVRKTAHNLMPSILLKHTLVEALITYCSYINARGSLNVRFQEYQVPEELPKDFELMIYRTIQELIQNMLKHAAATIAVIELEYRDGNFNVTVEDNGKGFDTRQVAGQGYGLQNIAFKVQALKGYISIESAPGKGTTISIAFKGEHIFQSFYN